MNLPFTRDQFLAVFASYNETVWPAQLGLTLIGLCAVVLASRGRRAPSRLVAGILALMWGWMGLVYHWVFFSEINPAAYLFGLLFIAQAVGLLWWGAIRGKLRFRPVRDAFGVAGALALAYALVVYPMIGRLSGHAYPHEPTFGLPCPTTIFTLGLYLWSDSRLPVALALIPLGWTIVGASAAISLGMIQDLGLIPFGLLVAVALVGKRKPARPRDLVSLPSQFIDPDGSSLR